MTGSLRTFIGIACLTVMLAASETSAGAPGACCLGDGTCLELAESVCDSVPGEFQGAGVLCADVTCVPFGGCCFSNLDCAVSSEADCDVADGIYQGHTTSCFVECPVVGACCLDDGTCVRETHDACGAAGGAYRGFQSDCTVSCTGACCVFGGSCIAGTTPASCAGQGGLFQGAGSICGSCTVESTRTTFSFDVNNSVVVSVPQFDDLGGTRELTSVSIDVQSEVIALAMLTNLSGLPVDTETALTEFLEYTPPAGLGPTETLISLDTTISCPGPALPPGESCDYGGVILLSGAAGSLTSDPVELAAFIGTGTIEAQLTSTGAFAYDGSEFQLNQTPHRVEGVIIVRYSFGGSGACCFPGGNCQDLTDQATCETAGGDWHPAAVCADAPCPPEPRACCLPNFSCVDLPDQDTCEALGGDWQPTALCADAPCAPEINACCFEDGSCQDLVEDDCGAAGGDWQPAAVCGDDPCPPPPPGACCIVDGTCQDLTEDDCTNANGVFLGDFTICSIETCDGACCFLLAPCEDRTQPTCESLNGIYQGNGTTCAEVTCPTPPGACCMDDGTCTSTTEVNCIGANGEWQGAFVTCGDTVCPTGCCRSDGMCIDIPGADCIDAGDVPQSTSCANVSCPQPGACCLDDGSCLQTSIIGGTDCTGAYQGDDTLCGEVECPLGCCLPDGTCDSLTLTACTSISGMPQNDDCANVTCEPFGACCFTDGSCVVVTVPDCLDQMGAYQGNATNCADVMCPGGGACCLPDGSCVDASNVDHCELVKAGAYEGDDTVCRFTTCDCRPPDVEYTGPCMEICNETVTCTAQGDSEYTFSVLNKSGVDVHWVLLAPAMGSEITPPAIHVVPPLPDGETREFTIVISSDLESTCFDLVLCDIDVNECCSGEVCIDLAQCCGRLSNEITNCTGPGAYDYSFDLENQTSEAIHHLFVLDPSDTLTIDPFYMPIDPPLLPGETLSQTIQVSGADVENCILLTIHNENFTASCSVEACLTTGCVNFNPCDIDRDGTVGFGDIVRVLGAWGPCPAEPACVEDVTGDGSVGFDDVVEVLAQWSDS